MDISRCVRRGTSGTTGPPIDILFGRTEFRYRQLALLRRVLADLGSRVPFRWAEVGAWVPLELRSRLLQRGPIVSVLRLPRSLSSDKQIRALERFCPHVVSGCPGDLQLVAADLARNPSAKVAPRLVISRGETLHSGVEELLQQAFGCRVTDYYNVQEVGNLAWRCPDHPDLMHVNRDTALLEIVDAEGRRLPAGIEGEVVVTNLTNATMPFIRYALGDRAWWIDTECRRCSCGAFGPSLSLIQGRSDDFVVLPDGRRVSPRAIDDLVMETFHATPQTAMFVSGIRAYQVIQETIDHLIVRVETSSTPPPPLLVDVMDRGLRAFHKDLTVEFQFVTELARGTTGKFRRVISAFGRDPRSPRVGQPIRGAGT
jgi:phenylacetate-CoA ligase